MSPSNTPDQSIHDASSTAPYETEAPRLVIPVIAEQLLVSKQLVETGHVTLVKTIHETDETVTVPLLSDQYIVERISIDQYVEEAPGPRQEGDTMIYPVLKEVAVVQKKLLLVEEIRVTRRQTETSESLTVKLRREDITVEREPLTNERTV